LEFLESQLDVSIYRRPHPFRWNNYALDRGGVVAINLLPKNVKQPVIDCSCFPFIVPNPCFLRMICKHKGTGGVGKEAVYSLVERGGKVRSHHVPSVNAKNLAPILEAQLDGATIVYTDEGATLKNLGRRYEKHDSVNHSIGKYVRGGVHTNTIEGYFSILKRGINGTYHHVSQQHL
jgi:hypothetical protein